MFGLLLILTKIKQESHFWKKIFEEYFEPIFKYGRGFEVLPKPAILSTWNLLYIFIAFLFEASCKHEHC